MPQAVRYSSYGGTDVLDVVDVPRPTPGPGQVLVRVRAAAINPGEAKVREGVYAERWPSTFPSGQGSDLAGVVDELGADVQGIAVGDEVIGFTDERASQAEYVVVNATDVTPKPAVVPWEVAASLYVAGTTAFATVRAVGVQPGDTVVVSGAAGGVGSLSVQLARRAGAAVIGIAGPANHEWLTDHGVTPVAYGEGLADRLRAAAPNGIDAFIDTYGDGYVATAIDLGVTPDRIDTVIDFPAVEQYGVKAEGNAAAGNAETLATLAELVVVKELEVPIAATYPLAEVQDAYRELEKGHTRGKIVLLP